MGSGSVSSQPSGASAGRDDTEPPPTSPRSTARGPRHPQGVVSRPSRPLGRGSPLPGRPWRGGGNYGLNSSLRLRKTLYLVFWISQNTTVWVKLKVWRNKCGGGR